MNLKVRNKLWIWSDTHFGHRNIIRYGERPESHEVIMLSNWAERVRDEDQILHLGDVTMGAPRRWEKIIARMPGEKFLMKGNHDHRDDAPYLRAGFEIVEPFIWRPNTEPDLRVAFTHEPIGTKWSPGGFPLDDWDVNIHGHVHQKSFGTKPVEYDGAPLPEKGYVNISVEAIDLTPVRLGNLLPQIRAASVRS